MVRALLGSLANLAATLAVLLATAWPSVADVESRHYVELAGDDQIEVTCSGATCTFDRPIDPTFEDFTGAVTVVNGHASLSAPRKCVDAGESHGDLTLEVSLTDELLTVTRRQTKGEYRGGGMICLWNTSETGFTAQRLAAELDGAGDRGSADPNPAPGPQPSSTSSTSTSTSSSVSRLESGEADAPSVLSALPAPADVEAGRALTGVLLAVILVLLVAFPTTLLNSAAEEGSDRFSAWWRGRRGLADPGEHPDPRWWLAGGGVFVAGVISCFVDPGFGFNAGSARTLLSVLTSFAIDVVVGWAVTIWVVRRLAPTAVTSYTVKPVTLMLVVVAVAFSRITGFEPGIIFGLVAGVGFGALVGQAQEARAALVTLGYGAAAGLVAWFGYGLMGSPDGVVKTFVAETLAATAIAGLAALPIALFPIPGMPGRTVFAWNRVRWVVCYALGLVAFFLVLMPTPYAWDEVGWSLRAWVLAYLGYFGAAVVLWSLVRRGRPAGPVEAGEDHLSRSGQA